MSLDVYLKLPGHEQPLRENRIFVRRNGQTVEISRAEWDTLHPGEEPCTVSDREPRGEVYAGNITHNLVPMADAAGLYQPLWRPEEMGITKARQLIEPLERGLEKLKADPAHYSLFNAANGWGTYEQFVPWVERYLAACRQYPDADVSVWR